MIKSTNSINPNFFFLIVLHAWYAKANRDKYVWFNDNSCNKFGKFRNLDLEKNHEKEMKEKVVSLHCQYGNFLINEDKYNLNAHLILHAWYAKANRDMFGSMTTHATNLASLET